jgi:hypothetical protein
MKVFVYNVFYGLHAHYFRRNQHIKFAILFLCNVENTVSDFSV